MQRYHAASCTSAVNNSALGGSSLRDTSRSDSSPLPANFSLNPRRSSQLIPYKLRCDKDPLNSRLGPPDFLPPTLNCPEETLTREYVQSGYRETVEGLEEAREISLSQVQTFTKPIILNCKEAIRKCHRAINESRAQKRKAGQVYGVPLSGTLLTKSGIYPEQRPCVEDFRKKWIEGLSQHHKRLRSLADHVPHGYRRTSLFEVLIRNNVPLLRATWFIKVTYLNQVRPGSSSVSSGASDKTHFTRSEQWTKDIIYYLQYLLDEFISRNNSHSNVHIRDRSPQLAYVGSTQNKSDPAAALVDGEEPSLHFKWWYVVRILQWHHAEGLVLPSVLIDWVLNQLQEKELLAIFQLLLPVIYAVIETVVLSQTYVCSLVRIAVRFIQEPSPGGSDLVDNSRRAYTTSALVEMLRYLIQAVPDAFVGLDCFPLPSCVVSHEVNDGNLSSKVAEDAVKVKNGQVEVGCVPRYEGIRVQSQSVSLGHVFSSVQKRADNLARAAKPGHPGRNMAKAVQALDKALVQGDVRMAYKFLFEDLCDGNVDESWTAEVSPPLYSSLKWIGTMSLSFVCSIFFICEWATCDFRNFRTVQPHGLKFTGRKDFSQVYVAVRLLKLKMRDMQSSLQRKNDSPSVVTSLPNGPFHLNNYSGRTSAGIVHDLKNRSKDGKSKDLLDLFQSPGPLHDIIVCWLDQHEVQSGEGFKRLQLLIIELIRSGIFYPQAYVRQLIVGGCMDWNGPLVDLDRRKRHHKILKQLPGPYICDALEEAQIIDWPVLKDAMHIYSKERHLVLCRLLDHHKIPKSAKALSWKRKHHLTYGCDGASPPSPNQWKAFLPGSSSLSRKYVNRVADLEELKAAISVLLQLPDFSSISTDTGVDESLGSVKRSIESTRNRMDLGEGTPGCEECRKVKRQKLSEDRSSYLQAPSPNPSDDEEIWWLRKGPKSLESFKVDLPLKPAKQATRGRQKVVRKTQSLAQLAAARIEGSQGASTSHVCDSRISCPHHRTGVEGDASKSMDGIRVRCGDIVSIGKVLKQFRSVEKRTIAVWLIAVVSQLVEETEKTAARVGQYSRPLPTSDERCTVRWKLGEEELSAILYLMDISNELVSAAKFLLWLLPKVLNSNSTIHGGRNISMLPRNVENHVGEVGEAFLLSSIRRYENILVASDLIPETLSASMRRVATVIASNGRVSGSAALGYARHLLKKYGNVATVVEWEKNFKAKCDKRLVSELESARSLGGEYVVPLGVPAGVEDPDDFFRQKISGVRVSRVGLSMRDLVQRQVDEAIHYPYGKERKLFSAGAIKSPALEKGDGGYQIAQQIVMGLMDCIRQTGGAAQEGDPTLVSAAISAIVSSVGQVIGKMPDLTASGNHLNLPSTTGSLNSARHFLRIHITCLCLLKEALGERQSRVFDIALATEASSALAQVFTPGKAPRSQFLPSPEAHDSNANLSNEILNNSTKAVLGRASKAMAAISALVVGAILHGVASLERMVTVFRLKEGLDVIQFVRSLRSNSNGNARSIGAFKADNLVEISVHWFRVLVGNCRTVSDGFIVDLLGEPSIVALSRMQRTLPLNLVFPPAYSIFAYVIWRPFLLSGSILTREDIVQLYQSLALAIGDAIKHLPFRDVCLRDTNGLYDLVAADATDSEYAAILESNGSDMHFKSLAFVPTRARLFLNAIVECSMPQPVVTQDDGSRISGHGESKVQCGESERKLVDKLVHVLDTLQPAKFHWQWVELRLLLNEQALVEKLDTRDTSLVEAIRSLSPDPDKSAASENENNFIEIILTRLLVRPDAAPLFSEVVHLFGRSLEDSMLLQAKWFLGGHDVLFGRKSIRQRLINIAESRGLSTKAQFWKPWGWCSDPAANNGDKRKSEVIPLEEGEVVDEVTDLKRHARDIEGFIVSQQRVTERALVELVLPCIDQSSDDSRNTFASDLIKQLNNIEQQINAVTRGASKQSGTVTSGIEGPANKANSRKGMRGSSPGLARRPTVPADTAALRASMSLRLQFLLRLFSTIWADREPSARNMRHIFASVVLRLLGSRVVREDADHSNLMPSSSPKRELESLVETSASAAVGFSGETLFECLLLVLYGLLSSSQPSWLKSHSDSKSTTECSKDFAVFDHEVAENLQNELDRMQLPDTVRWRIQTAMPILFPSVRWSISCQPPSVSPAALASLQHNIPVSGQPSGNSNILPRNPASLVRTATSIAGKTKAVPLQPDLDIDIDPWTLLEDGAGSGPSSSNVAVVGAGDPANLKASSWLKGAVRVRRTDLTYIGAVDDDS
ncbi:unnamed protein product [Ilex paraguariensis]|uniref:Mediator complex subunit Med12 domain-containing protein n=1 Tax=Ilex paraguariensis TaxID=185542 RepID=A0ABC8QPE4_9AQUA